MFLHNLEAKDFDVEEGWESNLMTKHDRIKWRELIFFYLGEK
jgi:hypothetical protein